MVSFSHISMVPKFVGGVKPQKKPFFIFLLFIIYYF
jgi:hypothetical protein